MTDYTISEYYELPSKGKLYKGNINPRVHLRSMTTEEEMKRLSHTDFPYKTLCDIIDTCLVEPIGISSYDMCLGDYQYLLHKLRVVTYGTDYPSTSVCPMCGHTNTIKLNLDEIEVFECPDDIDKYLTVNLPMCGKTVNLKYQTPRDLDEIAKEEREFYKKNPDSNTNITYLLTLKHLVESVDGQHLNSFNLDLFLRKLSMMDTNLLLQNATKINEKVGINTKILNYCKNPKCGVNYTTTFRITSEFFGPSI